MNIRDKPLYAFTTIILAIITLLAFFSCYYFVINNTDCHFNDTMTKWLIFYGMYDCFFGINLMVLNTIYTFNVHLPKSFFNIHTLFIIIPNIIILIIMASMGDLNLQRNECDYTKYYFYSSHWIFYSGVNFFLCYIGLMSNCIKMMADWFPDVDPAPHIINDNKINDNEFNIKKIVVDTNKIYECNICFENKKMYALKCKHTFCYDCIMKWNNNMHYNCMMCRQSLI